MEMLQKSPKFPKNDKIFQNNIFLGYKLCQKPRKLIPTKYVQNMNLKYLQSLHSLLAAMVTGFPQQQHYPLIHIVTKNIFAKYELKILSCCQVIAQFQCRYGNSFSVATR